MEILQTLSREELTRLLEEYAPAVYTCEVWPHYLRAAARFHAFSLTNILLLCAQKPEAVYVGGYHWWRDEFGRYVRSGEKGIRLLFPDCDEQRWRAAAVFDVSQTAGTKLPSFLYARFKAPPGDDPMFLQALLLASPAAVRFKDTPDGVNGFYRPLDQEIIIRSGMAAADTVDVLLYEIASALVYCEHHSDSRADRIRREIETAAIADIVCRHFMLKRDSSRFRHIGVWAKEQKPGELLASLETIRGIADRLIRLICAVRDPLYDSGYPDPLSLIAA
jgi:hypothetical protein